MVIQFTAQPDFAAKNTLFALLLAEENVADFPAHWAKWSNTAVPWEDAWFQKGKRKLQTLEGQSLLSLGMGLAPSLEKIRQAAHQMVSFAHSNGFEQLCVMSSFAWSPAQMVALSEALALSTYTFLPYKTKPETSPLETISVVGSGEGLEEALQKGISLAQVTSEARDLVNEPVITLTATELGNRIQQLGETYGFSTEVMGKAKIEALKMGGLLAVNYGSTEPPSFSILSYEPESAVNTQPLILVGKGVVYDTGGLSLKPTANSMDFMKADMAGAAAVIGAMCGVAALKLPYHVIGLVPATDNRPGLNAYTPGDVIHMYDGSTVEVLNTDAEGRMLLADALAYAKQYKPGLVIDLATLTGASVVAVGSPGMAMMSNIEEADTIELLAAAGEEVYERMVRFPLWEEYRGMLKSDIADLKNLGPREGGAITAAKFLEHFTAYPWVHLDIAGPSWLQAPDSYRGKGGTGVGVRLLVAFIEKLMARDQSA